MVKVRFYPMLVCIRGLGFMQGKLRVGLERKGNSSGQWRGTFHSEHRPTHGLTDVLSTTGH